MLLTGGFSLANAQSWNGSGPFPRGADSRTVHALAIDPAAGIVYAGTASGTVFALADPTLSQPLEAVDDFAITNPGIAIGVPVLTNDIDPEGALDASSVAIQSDPIHGTVTVTPDGTATYTPDPGFVGEDSFTYTARDLAGNTSNVATVTIRVNAPPIAEDDTASGVQNEPVTIDVLANDSDPDGSGSLDPATVAISDPPENGSAIVEADGRITYQSAANFTGVDSFAYTVGDGDGAVSNEATVTVTVSETPNVPPTAADDVAATNEGTPVTIDVLANDGDVDGTLVAGTVTVQAVPGEGTATVNANGSIRYAPAADFSGTDSFTYTVADDDGDSSGAATVTVTVNETPNTPPVASDDVAAVVEGASVTVLVLTNDSDADGTLVPVTVAVQGAPGNGSAQVNGDGSIRYTPEAGFSGNDSFTYTVEDNEGASSNAATVSVTVTAAGAGNAAPTASDDVASTEQGGAVEIDVLVNDSDAEGTLDPATVTIQTAPGSGSAEVNANGSVTYTPDAAFTGTDSFTYTVQDDEGASSNAATVQVTVTAAGAANEPPAALDDSATTDENTPVTIDVLANDRDADGALNPATVTVQTEPGEGSVAVIADGTVTYTPDSGFSGTDTFTYTVADDTGEASDTATVTVTVNAAANPPSPPSSGGGGGGGGATGLLLLVVMTFALLLRRSMNVGRARDLSAGGRGDFSAPDF